MDAQIETSNEPAVEYLESEDENESSRIGMNLICTFLYFIMHTWHHKYLAAPSWNALPLGQMNDSFAPRNIDAA